MKRRCIEQGCNNLTERTRCPEHQRWLAKRRGYDNEYRLRHIHARKALTPQVATGTYPCTRCGQVIQPTEPWDADQRPNGFAAAHAHCNRSAGAQGHT